MIRFFYPASRAHHAFSMAIDFGMRFKKRNGLWATESLPHIAGDDYKIEVAEESLHLLEPRSGDLAAFSAYLGSGREDGDAETIYWLVESLPLHAPLISIVQRTGISFHWPDREL